MSDNSYSQEEHRSSPINSLQQNQNQLMSQTVNIKPTKRVVLPSDRLN